MKRLIAGLAAVMLFSSCSSMSRMTGMWTDPEFNGTVSKVLVVGLFDDESKRRPFEVQVKQELQRLRFDAVSSLDVIPHGEKLDKGSFEKYFGGMGIDAVLVASFLGVEKEQYQTPGHTYAVPRGYYDFYGYYQTRWEYVNTAQTVTATIVKLETNLYETGRARLVWTAASAFEDPQDPYEVINEYSRIVVGTLAKEKFMKPVKK